MEIAVIGNEETLTAFRLGGVGRYYREDEATSGLKEILADKRLGLLIVTEKFAEENRKMLNKHRLSNVKTPIIVEVPGESGPLTGREDPIDKILKQAIGADVGGD